jgi:hypothetical protein
MTVRNPTSASEALRLCDAAILEVAGFLRLHDAALPGYAQTEAAGILDRLGEALFAARNTIDFLDQAPSLERCLAILEEVRGCAMATVGQCNVCRDAIDRALVQGRAAQPKE